MSGSNPNAFHPAYNPRVRTSAAMRIFAVSVLVTAALYVVPFGRTIAWPLVLSRRWLTSWGTVWPRCCSAATSMRSTSSAMPAVRRCGAAPSGASLSPPLPRPDFSVQPLPPSCSSSSAAIRTGARLLGVLGVASVRHRAHAGPQSVRAVFTLILGSALLLVALRLPRGAQTVVILLAVQLALSVFSRSDYLFTRTALTSAGRRPSDVAVMADALFLPYWFWGASCGALSVAILFLGFRIFFRGTKIAGPMRGASTR